MATEMSTQSRRPMSTTQEEDSTTTPTERQGSDEPARPLQQDDDITSLALRLPTTSLMSSSSDYERTQEQEEPDSKKAEDRGRITEQPSGGFGQAGPKSSSSGVKDETAGEPTRKFSFDGGESAVFNTSPSRSQTSLPQEPTSDDSSVRTMKAGVAYNHQVFHNVPRDDTEEKIPVEEDKIAAEFASGKTKNIAGPEPRNVSQLDREDEMPHSASERTQVSPMEQSSRASSIAGSASTQSEPKSLDKNGSPRIRVDSKQAVPSRQVPCSSSQSEEVVAPNTLQSDSIKRCETPEQERSLSQVAGSSENWSSGEGTAPMGTQVTSSTPGTILQPHGQPIQDKSKVPELAVKRVLTLPRLYSSSSPRDVHQYLAILVTKSNITVVNRPIGGINKEALEAFVKRSSDDDDMPYFITTPEAVSAVSAKGMLFLVSVPNPQTATACKGRYHFQGVVFYEGFLYVYDPSYSLMKTQGKFFRRRRTLQELGHLDHLRGLRDEIGARGCKLEDRIYLGGPHMPNSEAPVSALSSWLLWTAQIMCWSNESRPERPQRVADALFRSCGGEFVNVDRLIPKHRSWRLARELFTDRHYGSSMRRICGLARHG